MDIQDKELEKFIRIKNGWDIPPEDPPSKKNPNIRGEKIGTLWLDGKVLKKGSFPLLQMKKKAYCKTYGITKETAKKRFKLTY